MQKTNRTLTSVVVLLAGLLLGHLGFESSGGILGFILFIYCVGVQAGPDFLSAFKTDGLRYLTLAIVVAVALFAWLRPVGSGALPTDPRANVLLITLDTTRADRLGDLCWPPLRA